jgi:hypothetical protein
VIYGEVAATWRKYEMQIMNSSLEAVMAVFVAIFQNLYDRIKET